MLHNSKTSEVSYPGPIVVLIGSLRTASLNRRLAAAARDLAPDEVSLVAWERLAELPVFDEDREEEPGEVVDALRRALAAAGGLLVITPEYNGSMPGHLKTALDWASRPRADAVLRGLPAVVAGTSPSPGGAAAATADVARVLGRGGAAVIAEPLNLTRGGERFDDRGALHQATDRAALSALLAGVGKAARRFEHDPASGEPAASSGGDAAAWGPGRQPARDRAAAPRRNRPRRTPRALTENRRTDVCRDARKFV